MVPSRATLFTLNVQSKEIRKPTTTAPAHFALATCQVFKQMSIKCKYANANVRIPTSRAVRRSTRKLAVGMRKSIAVVLKVASDFPRVRVRSHSEVLTIRPRPYTRPIMKPTRPLCVPHHPHQRMCNAVMNPRPPKILVHLNPRAPALPASTCRLPRRSWGLKHVESRSPQ